MFVALLQEQDIPKPTGPVRVRQRVAEDGPPELGGAQPTLSPVQLPSAADDAGIDASVRGEDAIDGPAALLDAQAVAQQRAQAKQYIAAAAMRSSTSKRSAGRKTLAEWSVAHNVSIPEHDEIAPCVPLALCSAASTPVPTLQTYLFDIECSSAPVLQVSRLITIRLQMRRACAHRAPAAGAATAAIHPALPTATAAAATPAATAFPF